MKTIPILTKISCLAVAAIGLTAVSSYAQTIGSWQTAGADNGWCDYGLGTSYPADSILNASSPVYTPGTVPNLSGALATAFPDSLQMVYSGWKQDLCIPLESTDGDLAAFLANNLFSITFSIAPGVGSGYIQIYQLQIQAPGLPSGYANVSSTYSITGPAASDGNTVSCNGGAGESFNTWNGSPARTITITWNYSSILAEINPNPGYANIILASNSGGSNDGNIFYFNNAELSTVPEPSTLALIGLGITGLLVVRRRRN